MFSLLCLGRNVEGSEVIYSYFEPSVVTPTASYTACNIMAFLYGGDLVENGLTSKLDSQIMSRTVWIWLGPAVVCKPERKRNGLRCVENIFFRTVISFLQATV